jgi:hypothetical protein
MAALLLVMAKLGGGGGMPGGMGAGFPGGMGAGFPGGMPASTAPPTATTPSAEGG